MCNGGFSRFRHIVSGLAVIATTALLGLTLQASRDAVRLQGQDVDLAGGTLIAEFRLQSRAWRPGPELNRRPAA